MKQLFILFALALVSGCGTFTTLTNSDEEIAANLKRQNSQCESMPRVYSGVAYNMCKMNSTGKHAYLDLQLGFYLFDSVFSAATDTVALPFTAYAQTQEGNLVLENP